MPHTVERPAFLAKNRFGLEESLELDWPTLAAGIPSYTPTGTGTAPNTNTGA